MPLFTFPESATFEFPTEFKSSSLNEKSIQTFRIQRTIACGEEVRQSIVMVDRIGFIEEDYVIVQHPN